MTIGDPLKTNTTTIRVRPADKLEFETLMIDKMKELKSLDYSYADFFKELIVTYKLRR